MRIVIILIFTIIFSLEGLCQGAFSFDREKWVNDASDSLIVSYREKVTKDLCFFQMIKGKTSKELVTLLGKPDIKDKTGFSSKNTVGYVYCIDKKTVDNSCKKCWKKCNPCKRSSITPILTNGVVVDIVGTHAGG